MKLPAKKRPRFCEMPFNPKNHSVATARPGLWAKSGLGLEPMSQAYQSSVVWPRNLLWNLLCKRKLNAPRQSTTPCRINTRTHLTSANPLRQWKVSPVGSTHKNHPGIPCRQAPWIPRTSTGAGGRIICLQLIIITIRRIPMATILQGSTPSHLSLLIPPRWPRESDRGIIRGLPLATTFLRSTNITVSMPLTLHPSLTCSHLPMPECRHSRLRRRRPFHPTKAMPQ